MAATRVESTAHSTVVVCGRCGARFVNASRALALVEAAAHEAAGHPGVRALRDRAARG